MILYAMIVDGSTRLVDLMVSLIVEPVNCVIVELAFYLIAFAMALNRPV
jgi:hypothetical protein